MDRSQVQRVGVYVDASNIGMSGGFGLQYDILREFACRGQGTAMRLNVYLAFDEEEAGRNPDYNRKARSFHAVLRDYGYKVIEKKVRRFRDEHGVVHTKSNADLDMAVDALMQSERLDYVLMATGDGDFVQVVRALQSRGCRVEVVAFQNVSRDLRKEADYFTSGYIIPNLLRTEDDLFEEPAAWGEENSLVRGVCYMWNQEKGFGFVRYMKHISRDMWILDSRRDDSPYETAFLHYSQLPANLDPYYLPNREQIFEFRLVTNDKGLQAQDVKAVYHY
ncbi:MAG: NYN domain-containing protein [Candidatus Cloacimonetes bacterium]|nr:NYN domain-containing protein [Candidatus Cloacimonadota bacterium]